MDGAYPLTPTLPFATFGKPFGGGGCRAEADVRCPQGAKLVGDDVGLEGMAANQRAFGLEQERRTFFGKTKRTGKQQPNKEGNMNCLECTKNYSIKF